MPAKIELFRVANGDMTLVTFESGRTLLIDCRILKAADDPDDDTPDVATQLRDRLKRDAEGALLRRCHAPVAPRPGPLLRPQDALPSRSAR